MKKTAKTKPLKLRQFVVLGLFLLIFLGIAGLMAYGYINSRLLHIERTTLYLDDLPPEFDGKTILFVSDIDMVGLSGSYVIKHLFDSLEKLEPDMVILGGDYAGPSLLNRLNSTDDELALEQKRRELFSHLAGFHAPLGKFAVAGENDQSAQDLAAELALGGITFLDDSAATVPLGDSRLIIIGLRDDSLPGMDYGDVARHISNGDCVIAVTHNPAAVSGMMTAEAADTGQWADLILTGHTHHGQAVVGERTLIQLDQQEKRYPGGWTKESDVYILVSAGVGCDTLNLRIGTQPQVHLMTLKCALSFDTGQ